jgi:hypothetical protein
MPDGIDNPAEKYGPVPALTYIGAGGGSLAYGLSKVTDFDLIAEVATGSPELAGGAFLVAGAAGLAANFGLVELGE